MNRPRIGVIKYGVGNIFSAIAGLTRAGAQVDVIERPMRGYDALVLPGVGAYRPAAERLRPHVGLLSELLDDGMPVLGICLGLQLFFEESSEWGSSKGLGLLDGRVERLPAKKLPHIGWSKVHYTRDCTLLGGVEPGSYFYFVHSFAYLKADDPRVCATASHEGTSFAAVIEAPPLYGTQFHPERSDGPGARVLRNFIDMVGDGNGMEVGSR